VSEEIKEPKLIENADIDAIELSSLLTD